MIDQEIRDALGVDPSPEFLARVRTRIATEPAPSAWRWSWTVAAAGALAAAIVIAVAVSRPPQMKVPQRAFVQALRPAPNAEETVRRPGPLGPGEPVTARTAGPKAPALRQTRAPVVSGFSRTVAAESEILIDPRETHALQQLIAGVRDGHVDLSAAQQSVAPTPMNLPPVADIVIAPITIEPLAPPPGAEGVRP